MNTTTAYAQVIDGVVTQYPIYPTQTAFRELPHLLPVTVTPNVRPPDTRETAYRLALTPGSDVVTGTWMAEPRTPEQIAKWDAQQIEKLEAWRAKQTISVLQALLAIDQLGYSAQYEAFARSPDRTFSERAYIDRAQTWGRNHAFFNAAADALGFSESDKDDFFRLAATL